MNKEELQKNMKIPQEQAIRHDWDQVRSWNYKLTGLSPNISVVYAELDGDHGEVHTEDVERICYILDGNGVFVYTDQTFAVKPNDVITVPPHTTYNYHPVGEKTMKILLFMELWDN